MNTRLNLRNNDNRCYRVDVHVHVGNENMFSNNLTDMFAVQGRQGTVKHHYDIFLNPSYSGEESMLSHLCHEVMRLSSPMFTFVSDNDL